MIFAPVAESMRRRPGDTIGAYMKTEPFVDEGARAHLIESLRKAGLPK
jgi:hypothetical protein